jgi:tryptophanyl-tRNA synthetase
MWILSCYASMGYLSRMTQWKSKLSLPDTANPFDPSSKSAPALRLGLFSYPVLQAADILLYGTTHVPVGADQAQHLEFAREVANSFNHIHGPVLQEPETVLSEGKKVMSLTQPDKKMSKSHVDPKSRIILSDSRETIKKKFRSALTDSEPGPITYDPVNRPGVSNLLDILFYTEEGVPSTVEELTKDCETLTLKQLKDRTADAVESRVGPIRTRLESIMGEQGEKELEYVAEEGREKAKHLAEMTLNRVKDAIGLV